MIKNGLKSILESNADSQRMSEQQKEHCAAHSASPVPPSSCLHLPGMLVVSTWALFVRCLSSIYGLRNPFLLDSMIPSLSILECVMLTQWVSTRGSFVPQETPDYVGKYFFFPFHFLKSLLNLVK